MIGEIYTCAVQGTHCGAPFSVSLAYVQIQATPNNGLDLVTAFWGMGGPGTLWMDIASNKLKALCMSWSSATDVGAALLADRAGVAAGSSLPPQTAVLFHLRPVTPYSGGNASKPKYDIGRFYLPGLVTSQVDQYALTSAALTSYGAVGNAALELEVAALPAFRLVPFPKWVPPAAGELTVRSCKPDALVRRIKTRRPNTCELFAGAGQLGDRPLIDLPEP